MMMKLLTMIMIMIDEDAVTLNLPISHLLSRSGEELILPRVNLLLHETVGETVIGSGSGGVAVVCVFAENIIVVIDIIFQNVVAGNRIHE